MALDTTSNNNALPIYRFKFSEHFMDELKNFANTHRYDDAALFKERWLRWTSNDFNIEKIIKEEKRLSETGYDGDIQDKMFKTVRYYLKNKSIEKKEPKQRRKYVSISKNVITSMDKHIDSKALVEKMKPAFAYNNYSSLDEMSEIIDNETNRLISEGMSEVEALNKIKKTYKNRYYLQQKS